MSTKAEPQQQQRTSQRSAAPVVMAPERGVDCSGVLALQRSEQSRKYNKNLQNGKEQTFVAEQQRLNR
jgi:hypothetical protein